MKEFIISEALTEKAVLVGLITPEQNEQKVKEYLDELAFLADTAGAEAVKKFYQKLDYPNPVTFVGTGKLQEIKEYVIENEIGLVIFDDELSPKQLRNIETSGENTRPYQPDPRYICQPRPDCQRKDASRVGTIQIYVASPDPSVDSPGTSAWRCRHAWPG